MNKTLTLLTIVLIISACAPTTTPTLTVEPIDTVSPSSESPANPIGKKVDIVNQYNIEIPEDFTVYENLSNYRVETSNNTSFNVIVHPYIVSTSPIPGKCVVSTDFDAGIASAPIFCEGLELTNLFTISEDRAVKYGGSVGDLALLLCTANSDCPVEVAPEKRYSITYVFVIADKALNNIIEFYADDAFRGPNNEIDNFEGLGAVLHDSIIPSLSIKNP